MSHKLLFLCTGNYYRSRFAEMLFNALVAEAGLNWRADSRGLAIGDDTIGPISSYALQGLTARGVTLDGAAARYPQPVQEQDLAAADWVIALKEVEHRPYLEAQFPPWANQVEYWHVHDLDFAPAGEALGQIDRQVRALIERLGQG